MNEKDNGLNLPSIRRNTDIQKKTDKKITSLDLSKKSSVNSVLKAESTSVEKEVLQAEKGLDLMLVGDLTSSMRNYHSLLKNKFADLCNELFPLIKNLRIGIIFYLDHGSGDPYVTKVQPLTNSIQELVQFINNTPTGYGGDDDEAVEDALNDLLKNINWKKSNARSVVLFGDASPHPVNQCPDRHDFFNLTKELYKNEVTINSVYCGSYPQEQLQRLGDVNIGDFSVRVSSQTPPHFFSWIANVTGGMVIGVDSIEDLVDIIKASAAKDSGHLDDLEKEIRKAHPNKLRLIDVARKAEQRKKIGGNETRLLN